MNVEHEEKRADEWERDREAWNLPPRALSFSAVQDRYPVDASPEEPDGTERPPPETAA